MAQQHLGLFLIEWPQVLCAQHRLNKQQQSAGQRLLQQPGE